MGQSKPLKIKGSSNLSNLSNLKERDERIEGQVQHAAWRNVPPKVGKVG